MNPQGIWYYDEMETPVGPIVLSMLNEKAIRIDFSTFKKKQPVLEKWAQRYIHVTTWIQDEEKVLPMREQIEQYFSGRRKQFTFPYTMFGTPFQQDVWTYLIEKIPYGQTRTYKDVAEAIERPKAFRAVGGAVNRNPFAIAVPCHRIVGSNGSLVGYAGGLDKKEIILEIEGIK